MQCYAIHKYSSTLSHLKIVKLQGREHLLWLLITISYRGTCSLYSCYFLFRKNGSWFITFFPVHHMKQILHQELFSFSQNEKERKDLGECQRLYKTVNQLCLLLTEV